MLYNKYGSSDVASKAIEAKAIKNLPIFFGLSARLSFFFADFTASCVFVNSCFFIDIVSLLNTNIGSFSKFYNITRF